MPKLSIHSLKKLSAFQRLENTGLKADKSSLKDSLKYTTFDFQRRLNDSQTVNVNLFSQIDRCEEELAASKQEVLNKTHKITVLKSDQNSRFSEVTKKNDVLTSDIAWRARPISFMAWLRPRFLVTCLSCLCY